MGLDKFKKVILLKPSADFLDAFALNLSLDFNFRLLVDFVSSNTILEKMLRLRCGI